MAIFWFYGEIHIKEVVGDDTPTNIEYTIDSRNKTHPQIL
jgi:hypothetical protein